MNLKSGHGTLYFSNGDRFSGDFANDRMHGKGKNYMIYQFVNSIILLFELPYCFDNI
jgi:hypothetical protein